MLWRRLFRSFPFIENSRDYKLCAIMVRVISQDTYNETVKLNMEEFSMSAQEAIEETVKELEAQV